jgi:hypothetical protein
MGLLGGVDEQEEERECARGHGALLDRQPVDSTEKLFEGCRIALAMTTRASRNAQLLDDLE